jgi:uncharacterized protein involved in exopolysaccharide biosynthesis/Mrp family chromosome partitioning ATPase
MQLGDIYYALFRHKWKIFVCTLLGMAAGFGVYKLQPPPYQSEAKLLIRFIISDSSRSIGASDDTEKKSPDMRGETIINSELQILTSRDLSEIVARNIGPEKILAAAQGGKSLGEAASLVRSGLTVEVPTRSSTLRLTFQHADTELVQPILREIVSSYLKRHVEIHRTSSMVNDFLAQETDQLRARLAQIEEELRKLTNKAGVVSLEASKQGFATQLARIREEIYVAQAELAERNSIFTQMTKGQPATAPSNNEPAPPPATPAQIDAYQKLNTRLAQIQQRIQDVLTQFTEEAPAVKQLRAMLNETETQKAQMETQHPALTQVRPVTTTSSNQGPSYDPITEGAKINAIQARIDLLLKQMEQIRTEAFNLDQMEVGILELRRQKELAETNYRNFAASLESSRIKEAMGEGKISNIATVQAPTPPYRDWVQIRKLTAIVCASGLVIGLAWAFIIEFFLDHTLRRPSDVERLLRMPLFISIPKTVKKSRFRWRSKKTAPATAEPTAASEKLALQTQETTQLEPFHQTLRDRLISFFESINLQHKPKLIAVTGLRRGAGATTTAAGLARSFSETGEGNVLLVDMTQGQGSAQHFHRGTPIGLDQLFDTRNSAFVQQNLYVVSEHSGSERLAKGMPQRFNQLVPKLKTSDFDYIIFDMPAVSQISITPRLASFMDLVLLVVESEKTDRALAEQAAALLAQSKTNLGVILNQTKSYVPASLHHDREFLLGV